MSGVKAAVALLGSDPDLADGLPAADRAVAERRLTAEVRELERGPLQPQELMGRSFDGLGLLVLDGLLTRDVVVGGTGAVELIGGGDVVSGRDAQEDGDLVPSTVVWTVDEPTHVAFLDGALMRETARWPAITAALAQRLALRADRLARALAICAHPRVDARALGMLWHLADRWGRVGPDGVIVPLRLTHETLARLIGAQRPTVSTAVKALADDGLLERRPDGGWLLRPHTPALVEVLYRRREEWEPARIRAVAPGSDPQPAGEESEGRPAAGEADAALEDHVTEETLRRLREAYGRQHELMSMLRERTAAVRERSTDIVKESRRRRAGRVD